MLFWIVIEVADGMPVAVNGGPLLAAQAQPIDQEPLGARKRLYRLEHAGSMCRLSFPQEDVRVDFSAQPGRRLYMFKGMTYVVMLLTMRQLLSSLDLDDYRTSLFAAEADSAELIA